MRTGKVPAWLALNGDQRVLVAANSEVSLSLVGKTVQVNTLSGTSLDSVNCVDPEPPKPPKPPKPSKGKPDKDDDCIDWGDWDWQ